jgi:hypothetical protein
MRVIGWSALERLAMADQAFGWTVEMQVRALKCGLRVREIDVPYHPRSAGTSKISRTISGTVKAGSTILWVIARELLHGMPQGQLSETPAGAAAGATTLTQPTFLSSPSPSGRGQG